MASSTKLNLSNEKFEQKTGSTLNLNGNTIVSDLRYESIPTLTGDTQLVHKKYVDDVGSITGATNGLTKTGDGKIALGGTLTGDTTIDGNRLTLKANNQLGSSYVLALVDSSDQVIAKFWNDKIIEFGGSFKIEVPAGTASGAAVIQFLNNLESALRLGDGISDWIEFKSSLSGFGHNITIRKPIRINQGTNCDIYLLEFEDNVAAGASAVSLIGSIPLAAGKKASVEAIVLCSESGDRTVGGKVVALFKNTAGNTITRVGQDKAALFADGDATLDLIANNTNKSIDIQFTNDTVTGYAYLVCVTVWVKIHESPS